MVLFTAVVFVCISAGAIYYMQRILLDNYIEYRKTELRSLAGALDETISSADKIEDNIASDIDLLAANIDGRIIISDLAGKVAYDSKHIRVDKMLDRDKELQIGIQQPTEPLRIRVPNDLEPLFLPPEKLLGYNGNFRDVSIVYFSPIHNQSDIVGQVMIEEQVSSLENYLTRVRDNLIIFMTIIFLITSIVGYIVVQRSIVTPLNKVENICKKVSGGDFTDRLEVRSNDEFVSLARNFNTMVYNLEKITQDMEEKNEGLIHFSKELEARNEELNRKQKIIDFDLRLAHNVQQELLPQSYPKIEGIEISAANFQVGEIGGDCFGFYKIDDKKLGAFIGDVSGKGIAAALVMSMVTILFGQLREQMDYPAKVLGSVNDIMYRHFGSRHSIYLTCFFMTLDIETMTLTFSCAGHNPPFLYRSSLDELVHLESEGFGLGMFSKVIYEENSIKVQPGDKIVLFTDGVVDSRNPDGKMFGLENLKKIITDNAAANSYRLTHFVVEELEEFAGTAPRQDDLTVIIITIQDYRKTGKV